ncbi:recombinase RecT [Kribbella deserti]|uniref:Recombinase RecT n=1 Tax=Kribbella deserti TaxID=1926257 RepID=A0ABV6QNL7_9ACTN
MTETVSNAVATRDNSPGAMVQRYSKDFADVLPSHVKAETWVRLAVGALRRDPKVAEAAANNTGAFMSALLTAARLGLEPGTEQFYLVPQSPRKGAPKEILGITGYQGLVELMYRAGAVASVIVEAVREHDNFIYAPGRDERPIHEIDWDAEDRGKLKLVYAYAIMKGGATSKVVVLNRSKINEIKAKSASARSDYSPWNTNEEAMWLKSAARQLSKWVPTSAEYIREQLRAVRDVAAERPSVAAATAVHQTEAGPTDTGTGEVFQAEFVDEEAQASDAAWLAGEPA